MSNDHGYTNSGLIKKTLTLAQWPIVDDTDQSSIVGRENDQGIVADLEISEAGQHSADGTLHRLGRAGVARIGNARSLSLLVLCSYVATYASEASIGQ